MHTGHHTEGRTLHWARLYHLGSMLFGGRLRALHRGVLDLAAIQEGERVLDVGCGPGRLTRAAALAAGATGETRGIDASPEMISLATRKAVRSGSAATFRVAAVEALPAPDDAYDVVLANLMIHHLPPQVQREGVAQVLRVLAPGGRFVIGDFSALPGHGLGHLASVFGLRRGTEHAEHLRTLLVEAGFEAIEVVSLASQAFCVIRATKPSIVTA